MSRKITLFLVATIFTLNVCATTGLCDINYIRPLRISIFDFNSKSALDKKINCRFDTQAGNYAAYREHSAHYDFIITSDPNRYQEIKFEALPIFVRLGIASNKSLIDSASASSAPSIAMIDPSVDSGSVLYLKKNGRKDLCSTENGACFKSKFPIYVANQFELFNLYRANSDNVAIVTNSFTYKTDFENSSVFNSTGDMQNIYFGSIGTSQTSVDDYKKFIKLLSCTTYFSNFDCE